jgi:hypothetical protein
LRDSCTRRSRLALAQAAHDGHRVVAAAVVDHHHLHPGRQRPQRGQHLRQHLGQRGGLVVGRHDAGNGRDSGGALAHERIMPKENPARINGRGFCACTVYFFRQSLMKALRSSPFLPAASLLQTFIFSCCVAGAARRAALRHLHEGLALVALLAGGLGVAGAHFFLLRRLGAGRCAGAEGQGQVVAAIRDNSLFIRVSFSSGWVDKNRAPSWHAGLLLQRASTPSG